MNITNKNDLLLAHQSIPHPENINVEALVGAAAQALRKQSFQDAEDILRGALVVAPEHPEAWALYGETRVGLGQDDEARRALEIAQSLNDRDALTSLTLLELYVRTGAISEARALATWLHSRGMAAELMPRLNAVDSALGAQS